MERRDKTNLIVIAFCLTAAFSGADIRLPAVFGDHMVLQQCSTVTVWGWAEPGENVSCKASWQWFGSASTKADAAGNWSVRMKTPKAGGPYKLTLKGRNQIVLKDILLGEVWICSGQSNMQWSMEALKTDEGERDIAAADDPDIRLFTVKREWSVQPRSDCTGQWQVCTPETVKPFSAVAYYFGRALQQDLHVPIGLVHTSWGGTCAEAWTSAEALRAHGDFNEVLDRLQSPEQHQDKFPNNNTPSVLFNGMIHPLLNLRIAGVIWYQGESNADRPIQYRTLFPAMIADWRKQWTQGDFPFCYVQIAPWRYKNSDAVASAALREAQMLAFRTVPNVGMAVTMDVGAELDIHPRQKSQVGERLALWAMANTYNRKNVVYSGPVYKAMKIEGRTVRLCFDYADTGLTAQGGPLTDFEIAGRDRTFVPAEAIIDGNCVVVTSEQIAEPAAVRYAFKNWAQPNLFNAEGLPASSFRTDDWPIE